MEKIFVLLVGVWLPSLAAAGQLNCILTERMVSGTAQQTDFQVMLDATQSATQIIKGKLSTSQLVIVNGSGSWKLQNVAEAPQFNFSIAENNGVSFQYNPAGHPSAVVVNFDCAYVSGASGPVTGPAPSPKSFHCNFHEGLGGPGGERQSDQAFDIPYSGDQKNYQYIPKAKMLGIYGVIQMWGGKIFMVFETNGNAVETSGIGPLIYDTELSWAPEARSRASMHCHPVY